jgi:hypothetical protein
MFGEPREVQSSSIIVLHRSMQDGTSWPLHTQQPYKTFCEATVT